MEKTAIVLGEAAQLNQDVMNLIAVKLPYQALYRFSQTSKRHAALVENTEAGQKAKKANQILLQTSSCFYSNKGVGCIMVMLISGGSGSGLFALCAALAGGAPYAAVGLPLVA